MSSRFCDRPLTTARFATASRGGAGVATHLRPLPLRATRPLTPLPKLGHFGGTRGNEIFSRSPCRNGRQSGEKRRSGGRSHQAPPYATAHWRISTVAPPTPSVLLSRGEAAKPVPAAGKRHRIFFWCSEANVSWLEWCYCVAVGARRWWEGGQVGGIPPLRTSVPIPVTVTSSLNGHFRIADECSYTGASRNRVHYDCGQSCF